MNERVKHIFLRGWEIIEMTIELLIYCVTTIFEFWFISIIVIFIFIVWYLGYLT